MLIFYNYPSPVLSSTVFLDISFFNNSFMIIKVLQAHYKEIRKYKNI